MTLRRLITLALALALGSIATAQNRSFTNIYVFGDSLSDTGNLFAATSALGAANPPAPYYQGRFSNGPVWVERLGNPLALAVTAAPTVKSSMNFAFGGATAAGTASLPPALGVQIGLFRQRAITPGAGDLFTVLAGANDLIPVLSAPTTPINPASLDAAGIATAQSVISSVQTLVSIGAKNIVVSGLPNLGATPRSLAAGGPGGAGASFGLRATNAFNNELRSRVGLLAQSAADLNIVYVDVQGVLDRMIQDARILGFSNTSSYYLAPAAQGGGQGTPDSYIFWDDIHPTAKTHSILAGIVTEMLNPEAPIGFSGSLGTAALALQGIAASTFDGRAAQIATSPRAKGRIDAYASVNYANGDRAQLGRRPKFNYDAQVVSAGLDGRANGSLALGGAVNVGRLSANVTNDGGQFAVENAVARVYAVWAAGAFTFQADGEYGSVDISGIRRTTAFGGFATNGKTSGLQSGGGFKAGWTFPTGSGSVRPWVGLNFRQVELDAYTEKDVPALAMAFDAQTAKSTSGAVGVDASYAWKFDGRAVRLDLRGVWRDEMSGNTRAVSGRLADNFTRTSVLQMVDGDGGGLELGGSLGVGLGKNWSAAIGYAADVRQDDKLANRFTFSVQTGF
jgi:outer membrane lipase/esterase